MLTETNGQSIALSDYVCETGLLSLSKNKQAEWNLESFLSGIQYTSSWEFLNASALSSSCPIQWWHWCSLISEQRESYTDVAKETASEVWYWLLASWLACMNIKHIHNDKGEAADAKKL